VILPRRPGEFRAGDIVHWDRNGQHGTVVADYSPGDPNKPVWVDFGFTLQYCYPRQLTLNVPIEEAYDDWLEAD
jgi:hypothetical protein